MPIAEQYIRVIPETKVPGKPLGRHVRHDPRSKAYAVEPQSRGTVRTVRWERRSPILNQGDLGSCTGNAACGVLGTGDFPVTLQILINNGTLTLDEAQAVKLYSAATQIDNYRGTYPPTDTGSDGLSVAKACKALGFISGYRHILSLSAAKTAIQSGPFITGTNWMSGMDEPDVDGVVKPTGEVRGGHEYEVIGYNVATDMWEFVNSWGLDWGIGGHFFMSSASYAALLKADGDGTVFVPIDQPAPQPTPTPAPMDPLDEVRLYLWGVRDWIDAHFPRS